MDTGGEGVGIVDGRQYLRDRQPKLEPLLLFNTHIHEEVICLVVATLMAAEV